MKSRIRIALSKHIKNQPVIEVKFEPSEDALDEMVQSWREDFMHDSQLAFVHFDDMPGNGHNASIKRMEVIPINSTNLEDRLSWVGRPHLNNISNCIDRVIDRQREANNEPLPVKEKAITIDDISNLLNMKFSISNRFRNGFELMCVPSWNATFYFLYTAGDKTECDQIQRADDSGLIQIGVMHLLISAIGREIAASQLPLDVKQVNE